MRPSFFRRVKRAVRREFRRIKDEHRSTRSHRRRPSAGTRFRHWVNRLKQKDFSVKRRHSPKPHVPPVSKRIASFLRRERAKYAVVFSSKYLIITLNSTILYLLSFFLVHFLTHFVTAIAAWFCDINTTITYTVVDFHIHYWNWTEEMVIMVFSIPAIFALLIALLATIPFAKNLNVRSVFKRLRYFTRKQRRRHRKTQRQHELTLQVQRINKSTEPPQRKRYKKRLSWQIRLFLLWTLYHSTTYFFSGMLYSFLFHRRFGYVVWYAFDSKGFDFLFSFIAFLSLVAIGYAFSVQFFNSGRMYLNNLNDKNRMPFVVSQAFFPFIIGTVVSIVLQIPLFDPALILLNFSIFFLLLPLPSRAARYENLHFDSQEKTPKIFWHWLAWSIPIIVAIIISLKIGIPIRLP
ncbi:MAG: hypothetical protein NT040_04445 [Bacteroidetes bacterium]|nr:hypothetical protein [Bacteroidota bacterium]